jgi:hypothetical protein
VDEGLCNRLPLCSYTRTVTALKITTFYHNSLFLPTISFLFLSCMFLKNLICSLSFHGLAGACIRFSNVCFVICFICTSCMHKVFPLSNKTFIPYYMPKKKKKKRFHQLSYLISINHILLSMVINFVLKGEI